VLGVEIIEESAELHASEALATASPEAYSAEGSCRKKVAAP
jgi:hypothetical protein